MQIRAIITLLAGSVSVAAANDKAGEPAYVFTRAESFSYSEANPVTAYANFLIGPAPEGGEAAFSRNKIELGIGYKGLEFSVLHRNDYNLRFTPDAAQFSYLNKNRKGIPLGQEYDVDVWANQYQMSGVKLGYQLLLAKGFHLVAAYSHLYGTEAVSGYLGKDEYGNDGVIKMVEREIGGKTTKVIDGTLHADYFYTDDPLFRRQAKAPVGQGYAVDVGFNWQVSENLLIQGVIEDFAGKMRWDNIPYTIATATSEVIRVNDDGFLETTPSFKGLEEYGNFTQKFTERKRLSARYQWNKFLLGYEHDRYDVASFNRLVLGYHWRERWGVDVSHEVDTSAAALRLWTPVGAMSFTTDDLDFDNAHTLGFSWNLMFPL